MRRLPTCTVIAAALCTACAHAQSPQPPTTPAAGFESYRVVVNRNIFDPTRRQRRETPPQPPPSAPAPAPARDHIDLTGVLLSPEATVAFFEGSREEHGKVLKTGDTIAQYTIARIQSDRVVLSGDKGTLELPVGGSLQQTEDGAWQAQEREGALAKPVSLASGSAGTAAASSGSGSTSSSASDLLKKMLERRKKELGK